MNIGLIYYSATGNSKLNAEKIKRTLLECDLIEVTLLNQEIINKYDVIGFITPTFYLSIPPIWFEKMKRIQNSIHKPAFFVISYGLFSGKASRRMSDLIRETGLFLFLFHEIKMPESHPIMIKNNQTDIDAPNEQDLEKFHFFLLNLKLTIDKIRNGYIPENIKIHQGFWNLIIPASSKRQIMKKFGRLFVNQKMCKSCKKCIESCIYNAIKFDEFPEFNMKNCEGCYACYSSCAEKAIYTSKIRANGQYFGPSEKLKEKFK